MDYTTDTEIEDVERELNALSEGRRLEMGLGEGEDEAAIAGIAPGSITDKMPLPPAKIIPDPRVFFAYWGSLNQALRDRVIVYVYRKWPVLNKYWCPKCEETLTPPDNKRKPCFCVNCGWRGKITTNIDKLTGPIEASDVLQVWGTGHYMFMLVDTDSRIGGVVCSTVVKTETNFRNHPPAVPDKRDVVSDDPTNRSYVEYLRSKREKLRGDILNENGEEDFMSASNGELVNKLVDKIVDMGSGRSERLMSRRLSRSARGGEAGNSAMDRMSDLMAKTADRSNDFLLRSVERSQAMNANPMEQFKATAELVKSLMGGNKGNDSSSMVTLVQTFMARDAEMNKSVLMLYEGEARQLRTQITDMARKLETREAPAPVKTFKEMIQDMAEMKTVFRDVMGVSEGGNSGGGDSDTGFDWAGLASAIMPSVMSGIVAITHNLAIVSQAQQAGGTPGSTPGGSAGAVVAPISAAAAMPVQPQQPQPGAGVQPLQPLQSHQPDNQNIEDGQPRNEDEMNLLMMKQFQDMFTRLQPSLVYHLELPEEEADGGLFADELVRHYGEQTYKALHGLGEAQLKAILLQWGSAPVTTVALARPTHFDLFIHQFMTAFDETADTGEEVASGEGIGIVAPAPVD